jgi:hypothetical protein
MATLPDGYYAVLDPADPSVMTYWRAKSGRVKAWPTNARYGPVFLKRDTPSKSDREAYIAYAKKCTAALRLWGDQLAVELEADPDMARARFAALTTRCCDCGRALTDAASKVAGIGPECRSGVPDGALAALADGVARAHAAALGGGS